MQSLHADKRKNAPHFLIVNEVPEQACHTTTMMTHKSGGLLLRTALLLLLGACQKPPQITMTTPTIIDLSAGGGSGTITFTANRDWTASCSDFWVHVSPSSGTASKDPATVTARCDVNTTYEDRSATITIRAEDAIQTVTIRQPQNLGIVVPTQTFILTSEAQTIDVGVQANVEYSIEIAADWIRLPDTKGLSSTRYTFSVSENTTYDSRSATITIKPTSGNAQSQVISVKQGAKDGLLVEKTEYEVSPDGGTLEIAVQTNVEYEVKPDVDWIHYTQTKALDNKTVVLSIDPLDGRAWRSGMVKISQKGGSLNVTVTVSQVDEVADLGLSVKWRSWNLGATKPEEFGDYYAWGEVEKKDNYDWATYKWSNGAYNKLTKYCPANKVDYWDGTGVPDGKTVLDPEDDAAHVVLGGKWRMPTDEEWTELRTQCTWTWATLNGVNGYFVESKSNGNRIFLPAAGSPNDTNLDHVVIGGYYWSSSLITRYPDGAWSVDSKSTHVVQGEFYRYCGCSVRPVSEK